MHLPTKNLIRCAVFHIDRVSGHYCLLSNTDRPLSGHVSLTVLSSNTPDGWSSLYRNSIFSSRVMRRLQWISLLSWTELCIGFDTVRLCVCACMHLCVSVAPLSQPPKIQSCHLLPLCSAKTPKGKRVESTICVLMPAFLSERLNMSYCFTCLLSNMHKSEKKMTF